MEAYLVLKRKSPARTVYEEEHEDIGSASASSASFSDQSDSDSESESESSSSSEPAEDASSSGSDGGRFEMSSLMTQLPFKRGLSRFFDGKSQSFTSLAEVGGVADLAKPARKRLKPSRSCGGGLDARRHLCPRKPAAVGGARGPAMPLLRAQPRRRQGGFLGRPARPLPPARPVAVAGQRLLLA